jgi:hypothetical protein
MMFGRVNRGGQCEEMFLFRGPCERKESVTAEQMRSIFCLRRREITDAEDAKLRLAEMM